MAESLARLLLYLTTDAKKWLENEVKRRKANGEKLTKQDTSINMSSIVLEIIESNREKQNESSTL